MNAKNEVIDIDARKCIAVNTEKIKGLQENVYDIKIQVSNHIPTSIKELAAKNDKDHEIIYSKLDKIVWYIAISLIATAGVSIIVNNLLK